MKNIKMYSPRIQQWSNRVFFSCLLLLVLGNRAGAQVFGEANEVKLPAGPDAGLTVNAGASKVVYSTVNPKVRPFSGDAANFEQQMIQVDFSNVFNIDQLRNSLLTTVKPITLVNSSFGYRVDMNVYLYDPVKTDGLGRLMYKAEAFKTQSGIVVSESVLVASRAEQISSKLPVTFKSTNLQESLQIAGANNSAALAIACSPFSNVGWKLIGQPVEAGKSLFLAGLAEPFATCDWETIRKQRVVVQLEVTYANVASVSVPFIGTIDKAYFRQIAPTPGANLVSPVKYRTDIATAKPDYMIEVRSGFDNRVISESRYFASTKTWEDRKMPTAAYADYSPTGNGTIAGRIGDEIVIKVKKQGTGAAPSIEGIPGVWVSGFAYSMSFICSPNVSPGEFNPFIPWDAQTHYKNYNAYPKGFQVRVPGWQTETDETYKQDYWVWSYMLQREMNAAKTNYNAQVSFPQTRKYNSGFVQTEGQAIGHVNEFLYFWKNGSNNGLSKKYVPNYSAATPAGNYTLTFDADEVLYDGSFKLDQNPKEARVNLLQTGVQNGKIGWQIVRPGTETQTYTEKGYPKDGFALNEYITLYQKYKTAARGLPATNFKQYDGYLIEDYKAYRKNTMQGDPLAPTGTVPVPCTYGCRYNPEIAGANVTNPGVVTIGSPAGAFSFKMQVTSPLVNTDNPALFSGFYSVIKGTNNPMSWNEKTTYRVTGLQKLSPDDLNRLSVAVLSYKQGGRSASEKEIYAISRPVDDEANAGIPAMPDGGTATTDWEGTFTDLVPESKIKEIMTTGIWDVEVKIDKGQSVIVLYYRTYDGEKAILAGRDVYPTGPKLSHISAPGSESYPFDTDPKKFVPNSAYVDLKEGEGIRPLEHISDYRKYADPYNQFLYGEQRFMKEYVIRKGQALVITGMDLGIPTIETYNKEGANFYTTWRDLCRVVPTDTVAKYLVYKMYEVEEGTWIRKTEAPFKSIARQRHGDLGIMNKAGIFEVQLVVKGMDWCAASALVKVVDYPSNALDNLGQEITRGKAYTRALNYREKQWLLKYKDMFSFPGSTGTDIMDIQRMRIATVSDVLSEYKYRKGPRATDYNDRFGGSNDYNDQYKWDFDDRLFSSAGGNYDQDHYTVQLLPTADITSVWPEEWSKIFVRHTSSNHFPTDQLNPANILKESPVGASYNDFNTALRNIFQLHLKSQEKKYGPYRWMPWINATPTEGFDIAKYTKGATDLVAFFNGTGEDNGAWSGQPYQTIQHAGTPIDTDTRITDDVKNFMAFFTDLKYGKKIIFDSRVLKPTKCWNINPKKKKEDEAKPAYIFIANVDPVEKEELRLLIAQNLFKDAYSAFDMARDPENGMYYNKLKPDGKKPAEYSISATGFGLISLCIAAEKGWLSQQDAAERVLKTLHSVTGHLQQGASRTGFQFKDITTKTGFPAQYYNKDGMGVINGETGLPDYSTVDASLLTAGALFAKKYFENKNIDPGYVYSVLGMFLPRYYVDFKKEIATLADQLFASIHWKAAVVDGYKGLIFHSMDKTSGKGFTKKGIATPYSDYMLAAYFAYNDKHPSTEQKEELVWTNFYAFRNGIQLPTAHFLSENTNFHYDLFTDNKENKFVSSFVPQFMYFLCHPSSKPPYLQNFVSNFEADLSWWMNYDHEDLLKKGRLWGHGAGTGLLGYRSNKINDNPSHSVNPPIMAGFLPAQDMPADLYKNFYIRDASAIIKNLTKAYTGTGEDEDLKAIFELPESAGRVLWVYDRNNPAWRPNELLMVDFAPMLFGLASQDELMKGGHTFFPTYNNFFNEPVTKSTAATVAKRDAAADSSKAAAAGATDLPLNVAAPDKAAADKEIYFAVYPNPANSQFTIEFAGAVQPGEMAVVALIDVNGRTQFTKNYSSNQLSRLVVTGISNLASGPYVIKITAGGKVYTKTIMLNK